MSKSNNQIQIMQFNKDGLEAYKDFIVTNFNQKKGNFSIPLDYLTTPDLIKPLKTPKYIDLNKAKTFDSRYELAEYLYNLLHQTLTEEEIYSQGLWEWLALFYFDMFTAEGGWKLRRMDNYIYMPSKYQREKYGSPISPNYDENTPTDSRHCVRASYMAYQAFKKNAKVMLEAKSGSAFRGDMAEQMLSRRWLKDYPMIVEAAMKSSTESDGSQKKAWLSVRTGYIEPGSLRSFISRVDNFMFSHNFNKLDTKELRKLLGSEFS